MLTSQIDLTAQARLIGSPSENKNLITSQSCLAIILFNDFRKLTRTGLLDFGILASSMWSPLFWFTNKDNATRSAQFTTLYVTALTYTYKSEKIYSCTWVARLLPTIIFVKSGLSLPNWAWELTVVMIDETALEDDEVLSGRVLVFEVADRPTERWPWCLSSISWKYKIYSCASKW